MALRVVSPELVLVDPTLLGEARDHASGPGGDTIPEEEQMSGETTYVNGSNGATPEAAGPAGETAPPSLETILFKAGLITADQLGEVVLERVQSGRPAGDIVVERGLVSREVLAGVLAGAAAPAVEPVAEAPAAAQPLEALAAPVEAVSVEAVHVEAVPVEAVHVEAVPVEAAPLEQAPSLVAVPAPAEPAVQAETPAQFEAPAPVEQAAPPVPEAYEPAAAVEAPAEPAVEPPAEPALEPAPAPAAEATAVEEAPAPAEPQLDAQPGADPAPADDRNFSMGEVLYAIRIRLSEGLTLDAGSFPSRERAVEAARGIAGQLTAEGGEWPLVGDTLVRPEAVLAIEIESAVSWYSSREA